MNAPTNARQFHASEAKREKVPLLIGLFAPSGAGKTFSALRLATGMQQVTGGDIYMIDTEAKRSLHYADDFNFKHIEFGAPFGSLDYLEVIRWAVGQGARTVIVDSMSHEHEGVGGYLMTHAAEMERMGNNDKNKFTAWIKPAQQRRQLINGLLQLNANFIFCFRAKDKLKIVGGRPIPQGWMPIAGEEFLFEMTMNALLEPASDGRPTWQTEDVGSRMMIKQPKQFRHLDLLHEQLGEPLGKLLATWSEGGSIANTPTKPKMTPLDWANQQAAALKAMALPDQLYEWLDANGNKLEALKAKDAATFETLNALIAEARERLDVAQEDN